MPRMFRLVEVGGRELSAWIEGEGRAVTMTVDSEPWECHPLYSSSKDAYEAEAEKYFSAWLKENFGITYPDKSEGISLVEQLERLAKLRESGMLTEDEFVSAKSKLIGLK